MCTGAMSRPDPILVKNGYLEIPNKPVWGYEVNEKASATIRRSRGIADSPSAPTARRTLSRLRKTARLPYARGSVQQIPETRPSEPMRKYLRRYVWHFQADCPSCVLH